MGKEVSNMKSLFTILVAVLMVLSFSLVGFAGTVRSSNDVGSHHMMTLNGKVVSVNNTDHTMVVKGKKGDMTFDTKGLTNTVKAGDKVKVTYYTDENGRMVVSSLSGKNVHTASNRYGHKGVYDKSYQG